MNEALGHYAEAAFHARCQSALGDVVWQLQRWFKNSDLHLNGRLDEIDDPDFNPADWQIAAAAVEVIKPELIMRGFVRFPWRTAETDPVGFIMDWRDFLADIGRHCHNGDWVSVELMHSQVSEKH